MDGRYKRKHEQALSLPELEETEEATKERTLFKRRRVFGDQKKADHYEHTLKDDYGDSLIFDARFYKTVLVHIINRSASYGLKYKILACIDPVKWSEVKAETVIAVDAEATEANSDGWVFFKIQAKNETAGQNSSVEAYIAGKK